MERLALNWYEFKQAIRKCYDHKRIGFKVTEHQSQSFWELSVLEKLIVITNYSTNWQEHGLGFQYGVHTHHLTIVFRQGNYQWTKRRDKVEEWWQRERINLKQINQILIQESKYLNISAEAKFKPTHT